MSIVVSVEKKCEAEVKAKNPDAYAEFRSAIKHGMFGWDGQDHWVIWPHQGLGIQPLGKGSTLVEAWCNAAKKV